jgi:hypothetical protein
VIPGVTFRCYNCHGVNVRRGDMVWTDINTGEECLAPRNPKLDSMFFCIDCERRVGHVTMNFEEGGDNG